ncbi:GDSL esterase/lipase At4g10955 isoform X2 [Hevea brasiliensis]|nr:GDSL esterase/lipase At4g10955 isoform X2 [Hevea brasiliensis]
MSFNREIFNDSGPSQPCSAAAWDDKNYQRMISACLVQGVYNLEHDRLQNRQEAHDSQWWDSFHFQLRRKLEDTDKSVSGCIYELKSSHRSTRNAPKIVIAFRGTILKSRIMFQDLKMNLKTFCYELHTTPRFQLAVDAVVSAVGEVGVGNVWLAGHSLGSALALLVGKSMAKRDRHIKTFLFNPPFLSLSEGRFTNDVLKNTFHVVHSVAAAGLSVLVKGHKDRQDQFARLSNWKPLLFVNKKDHICSGYIEYFRSRIMMEKIGLQKIERTATMNSLKGLIKVASRKESEPLHLIPSAKLFVNRFSNGGASSSRKPCPVQQWYSDFREAHGIQQWWSPDVSGEFEEFSFN